MTVTPLVTDEAGVAGQTRSLARPLEGVADPDALVGRIRQARYVCVGEASHGTSDYYRWRALLSRRLVEEHGSHVFPVPSARAGSHEALLHDLVGRPAVLVFPDSHAPRVRVPVGVTSGPERRGADGSCAD